MLNSFPRLVNELLADLPQNDYPVLNTRLFLEIWFAFILDQSVTSLRDLFARLNHSGYPVNLSTFSRACQRRTLQWVQRIYKKLQKLTRARPYKGFGKMESKLNLCPIDATVISLTSKLLWAQQIHQVKLYSGVELGTGSTTDIFIQFGYDHDAKSTETLSTVIPENGVGVFDRGFAGLKQLKEMAQQKTCFVIRIPTHWKLEWELNKEGEATGNMKVGTTENAGIYRVVNFCDLESKAEYRLVTNLGKEITDEEVMEIYINRWQIELLWKFLKMHLKLDKLVCKNQRGIEIQIYMTLIVYLILELVEIPKIWGRKLLDKLRYLQACMSREISYVHWLEGMVLR